MVSLGIDLYCYLKGVEQMSESLTPTKYDIRLTCEDRGPRLFVGKYKGHSYLSVVYWDPQYCDWVMGQNDAKGDMMAFQKWLIQRCEQYKIKADKGQVL